jgi:hypothetical protein
MTPNQAARTICPLLSIATEADPQVCLETRCMAWRWYDPEHRAITVPFGKRPIGLGWHRTQHVRDGQAIWIGTASECDRRGYCSAFPHDCTRRSQRPAPAKLDEIEDDPSAHRDSTK